MLSTNEEPQSGSLDALREILRQVVMLRSGKNKNRKQYSKDDVNLHVQTQTNGAFQSVEQLSNAIQNMERNNVRPTAEGDLSPLERGAIARLALVGHGMSLGFSDEIGGAMEAVADKMQNPSRSFGDLYRESRDARRQYMRGAVESSVNTPESLAGVTDQPGWLKTLARVARPEAWGMGATGLLGGEALLPEAAGIVPGMGYAGALSAASDIGEAPSMGAVAQEAPEIMDRASKSALFAGALGLAGKAASATIAPGWMRLKRALRLGGGRPGLDEAVAETGIARPTLSELESTEFSRLPRSIQLGDAKATTQARRMVRSLLNDVRAEKAALNSRYDVLNRQVQNPRAQAIIEDDFVKPVIDQMVKAKMIRRGRINGRGLEDIRQRVSRAAEDAYRSGNSITGEVLRNRAEELKNIIDNLATEMPELRAQWRRTVTREDKLDDMLSTLQRRARRSRTPGATDKISFHHALTEDVGGAGYQRGAREARQMVGPLFTPGTSEELYNMIHKMQPWWATINQASGAAGNPYFQFQPQEEH